MVTIFWTFAFQVTILYIFSVKMHFYGDDFLNMCLSNLQFCTYVLSHAFSSNDFHSICLYKSLSNAFSRKIFLHKVWFGVHIWCHMHFNDFLSICNFKVMILYIFGAWHKVTISLAFCLQSNNSCTYVMSYAYIERNFSPFACHIWCHISSGT